MSTKGQPPVKKFRLRRVEVAVWAKEGDDGYVNYQISAQKSFRDKQTGEYINTSSFYPEEAALVSVLIPQALAWVAEQKAIGSRSEVKVTEEVDNDPFERTA